MIKAQHIESSISSHGRSTSAASLLVSLRNCRRRRTGIHMHPYLPRYSLGHPATVPCPPMAFHGLSVSSFQKSIAYSSRNQSHLDFEKSCKIVRNEKTPVIQRAKCTIAPSNTTTLNQLSAQVTGDPPYLALPRLRRKALRPRRTSGPWPQVSKNPNPWGVVWARFLVGNFS